MHKLSLLFTSLALAVPAAAADQVPGTDARARAVAPYLDEQTIGLAHVDVARLSLDALVGQLAGLTKLPAQDLARFQQAARRWVTDFTRAGGKDLYLIVSLADLPEGPFLVAPLQEGADGRAVAELLSGERAALLTRQIPLPVAGGTAEVLDHLVFVGGKAALERIRAGKSAPRPEVAEAFAAAGDTAAQALLLPTADARRAVREIMPALPREVGGGPSTVVTRGLVWAALGVNGPPGARLHMVIQSEDARAAEAFRAYLTRLYEVLGSEAPVRRFVPHFDQVAAQLTPKVTGDRLTLAPEAGNPEAAGLLAAMVGAMTEASHRTQCQNNLKQIGLALHQHHDAHGKFPAVANFDKRGRPLLSWRVHLLPFLGQEKLYREFHLDEPWDSEHNRKLIPRMPAVYRCPSLEWGPSGKTSYLAPVGPALMFTGTPQQLQIKDVTDGTSNTIFIVDAADAHAVIWTRPEDLRIDPKDPGAGLIGHHRDGFLALFADGSVQFLGQHMDRRNLFALFTRNGGEVVTIP